MHQRISLKNFRAAAALATSKNMKRRRPEQDLQRTVVEHLQWRAVPNLFYFHPANGGARTAVEGAI
jgi:hypothetical protein